MKMCLIPITLSLFITVLTSASNIDLRTARKEHRPQVSTNSDLRYLASISRSNDIDRVLDNIECRGNHEKVSEYIENEVKQLKWSVSGNATFKNIIATPNPNATRFLVLACRYDWKYFENGTFKGPVELAVPYVVMLNIAMALSSRFEQNNDSGIALKLIFFDGEEALENLVKKWYRNTTDITELDRIDMLILLNSISTKNPIFLNLCQNTTKWFERLAQIENELHRLDLLKQHRFNYFLSDMPEEVEDDHFSFLKRHVPILYFNSVPSTKDNPDIIDKDTVTNINLILNTFISEYLQLSLEPPVVAEENPIPLIVVFAVMAIFFIYVNCTRHRFFKVRRTQRFE